LRRRPGRRASSTSRYRRSSSLLQQPGADLGVQRRLDPPVGLRFPPGRRRTPRTRTAWPPRCSPHRPCGAPRR
jgi:hypothetical protein